MTSVWLLMGLQTALVPAATVEGVMGLINAGHWRKARQQIEQHLAWPGLSFEERETWLFQQERMARIRLDFDRTRAQVLQEARQIAPQLSDELFARWEKAGVVEFLDVDGDRWFFHSAARNVFRVHPEAGALKHKGRTASPGTPGYRLEDIRQILAGHDQAGQGFNTSRTWRVTYALTVKADAVPAGETLRAWLPFPHRGDRQTNLRLVSTDPPRSIQSEPSAALASLYLEKRAIPHEPTRFRICFEYSTTSFHQEVEPARVRPVPPDDPSLAPFLAEQPPHLVFSDAMRRLSREIVGPETNSWLKARRIFQWVSEQIPWASAREYSTLDCLSRYALIRRQGDCGIQTMLFMTLCRLNGIPARWESGWTTGPDRNMHDWCQIHVAPYGWLPVDVSYGLVTSEVEREKWFYLGGMDCHRLVVNTDHSQPLYPAKMFARSEYVDFQRGEVEWRGGNLYFNQWEWEFTAAPVPPGSPPDPTEAASKK